MHEEEEYVEDGVIGSSSSSSEEAEHNLATGSSLSSSEEAEHNPPSPVQGRVRRAPTWMEDYVSGEELSEQEENNLMMCTASSDPMSFEEPEVERQWNWKSKPLRRMELGN